MTLLELLVKELPKRGGWPEGASHSGYEIRMGTVSFTENGAPGFNGEQLSIHTINGAERSAFWLLNTRFKSEKPDDYATAIVTREQYEDAIAAHQSLQQPVWNGEGLPPVGLRVELMDDSQSQTWGEVTIKYYGDSFAVWDDNGEECSNSLCHVKVRPILTEAERKREETVEIMRSHVTNYNKTDVVHAIEELYDAIAAGKIKGVSLSDD